MSTEVERLIARLEVQQSQFERQLRRAQATTNRAARGIENRFKRTNATVTKDFAAMGARIATVLGGALGFGVGFGASQLIGGIRSAVGELSALGKEARAASLPVEDLQGLIRGFERNTTVNGAQVSRAFTDFAQRVGEAAQGTGELKRVVDTYGLSLTDANGNLRSQRELLNEVANLIRSAPNDQARTMIANAAFGEPGRQMADALRGGSEALDRMIADARTAGDVLDRDLIQRAEILDDKFDALTRRVGTFFKALAVGAAGATIETPLDALERIFGGAERARSALGDDLFEALTADLARFEQSAAAVDRTFASMKDSVGELRQTLTDMADLSDALFQMGELDLMEGVLGLSGELTEVSRAFFQGKLAAEDMENRLRETAARAVELVGDVEGLNSASLSGIISRFSALAAAVMSSTVAVQALRAEAGLVSDGRGPAPRGARRRVEERRDATQAFLAEEERLASRTREQIDLETELGRVQRRAKEDGVALTEAQASAQAQANLAARQAIAAANSPAPAGGSSGGGGGGSGGSDFARAVEAIQERTRALEAEAAALVATALSGREYGDAYEFAMQKAKLTYEAQKQGLVVNAELEATINRLAEAYVNAGQAAEAAAQGMKRTADEAQKGAGAISSIFSGILTGATKAEDAVRNLLSQLVSAQFNNLFAGLASTGAGGGFFATIGRALGFADGGYTGAGGKHEPKGIVHAGEYVMSAEAVERMGVRNMERLHRQLRGFRQGGYVGAAASPAIGGGAPIVNVINKTGQPSETRRSTGPDGREVIDVLVGESLSSGRQDKPLGRFGLRPQPVRR